MKTEDYFDEKDRDDFWKEDERRFRKSFIIGMIVFILLILITKHYQ